MIEFDRDECFVTNYEDRFTYGFHFWKNALSMLLLFLVQRNVIRIVYNKEKCFPR